MLVQNQIFKLYLYVHSLKTTAKKPLKNDQRTYKISIPFGEDIGLEIIYNLWFIHESSDHKINLSKTLQRRGRRGEKEAKS